MSSQFSNIKFSIFRKRISGTISRGFTLIELMVTIGIFVFMTALLMARYNSFYSGTIFTNLAYDVALTIRQAQTYGISVKADTTSGSGFNSRYAVRIESPTDFSLVHYDYISGETLQDAHIESHYSLKQGAKFQRICYDSGCVDSTNGIALNFSGSGAYASIVFERPKPEPMMIFMAGSVRSYYMKIIIVAGDGVTTHNIIVNSVGQISVQ